MCLFRQHDRPRPVRPPAGQRRKQQAAVGAGIAVDDDTFTGVDDDIGLLEAKAARGLPGRDRDIAQHHGVPVRLGRMLAIGGRRMGFHQHQRLAEIGDAHQRRLPVGDGAEIVDIPAQRRIDLVEGTDRHHQPAKGQIPGEIDGRGDQDRRDDRQPAITGRNPAQVGGGHGQLAHGLQDGGDIAVDAPALGLLALLQSDRRQVLVGAHQRGAQLRFLGVALGGQRRQAAPDDGAEQRSRAGIEEDGPDHIAGNGERLSVKGDRESRGQIPEHPDEADQHDRRLRQPDRQAGGDIGQMRRILVQALVRIDAEDAGGREPERPARIEPLAEQVARQPVAHADRQDLVHPGLPDIEQQQDAGDDGEDPELMQEAGEITPLQRIVKGAVPVVEQHLHEGGGEDDGEDERPEEDKAAANRRTPQGPQHHADLRHETDGRLAGIGVVALGCCFVIRHGVRCLPPESLMYRTGILCEGGFIAAAEIF